MGEHSGGNDSAVRPHAGEPRGRERAREIDGDCLRALLDDHRRQLVLEEITDAGVATIGDVATLVAAREAEASTDAVGAGQRREVEISLYHVHVPKMADVGLLNVDGNMERIRPGPTAGTALDILDRIHATTDGEQPSPDT